MRVEPLNRKLNRTILTCVFIAAASAVTTSACVGNTSDTGPGAADNDLDTTDSKSGSEAVGELATGICDVVTRCCSRPELDYAMGPFVDETNCSERLVQSAEVGRFVSLALPFARVGFTMPNVALLDRAIANGRATVNSAGLTRCLDHLAGLTCNQLDPVVPPTTECTPPTLSPTRPCETTEIVTGAVGEFGHCSQPGFGFECEPGLICRRSDRLGDEGACVRPGQVGDFCFHDGECGAELYCSLLDGTCQVPRGQGESCQYVDPDDSDPPLSSLLIRCESPLSCDPVTGDVRCRLQSRWRIVLPTVSAMTVQGLCASSVDVMRPVASTSRARIERTARTHIAAKTTWARHSEGVSLSSTMPSSARDRKIVPVVSATRIWASVKRRWHWVGCALRDLTISARTAIVIPSLSRVAPTQSAATYPEYATCASAGASPTARRYCRMAAGV